VPISFNPRANDEYEPPAPSAVEREALRRARTACDDNARRTGMSRRAFLRSVCGAATTLAILDACSNEARKAGPTSMPGGTFSIPPEATVDPDAATGAIGTRGEFIFDVQTHLLEGDGFGSGFPQADCGDEDCFSTEHWLDLVFAQSDTSLAVLSAIPVMGPDSPLSPAVMDTARRVVETSCRADRLILHGQVQPPVGRVEAMLAGMERSLADHAAIGAWKVYTHSPAGWFLDDHDADLPQVGDAFIRKAVELGVPRVCVHKGLSGGDAHASPVDIGPAAARHRDASFVAYHSGYESGVTERAYDPAKPNKGADRLLASMDAASVGPNANVYAELGSTWWQIMHDPDAAAHLLGKLLVRVGEDNVLWGTDSIWYGSPQSQIEAFRAFQITEAFQETYGYPELNDDRKAKILGLNAARLYGVEPKVHPRCDPVLPN
jgi:uncharacterized protein